MMSAIKAATAAAAARTIVSESLEIRQCFFHTGGAIQVIARANQRRSEQIRARLEGIRMEVVGCASPRLP